MTFKKISKIIKSKKTHPKQNNIVARQQLDPQPILLPPIHGVTIHGNSWLLPAREACDFSSGFVTWATVCLFHSIVMYCTFVISFWVWRIFLFLIHIFSLFVYIILYLYLWVCYLYGSHQTTKSRRSHCLSSKKWGHPQLRSGSARSSFFPLAAPDVFLLYGSLNFLGNIKLGPVTSSFQDSTDAPSHRCLLVGDYFLLGSSTSSVKKSLEFECQAAYWQLVSSTTSAA